MLPLSLIYGRLASAQGGGATDLANPPERKSPDGELSTTLTVVYSDNNIGGKSVHLRNYEGMLTGPTLRVRPGQTLNVLLRNNLPPEPPNGARHPAADASQNPPHGFNTTNLHTHGLHVSPVGNSDNVFLELGPGQEFPLEIKIPRNHHPGTFWYHAHKHGSVALQLASGMAGALIVEGGLDDVPAIKCARDRVMVLQQIAYDDQGQVEKSYYDQPGRPAKTTINGRVVPEIQMRPGEVQRWRMIHAGIQRELNLTLDGHQLNEIACDGIALGTITPRPAILLCPGYRSDVLVQAQRKGQYTLKAVPVAREIALFEEVRAVEALATVVVDGDPVNMKLPTEDDLKDLAPFRPIDQVQGPTQEVTFNIANGVYQVNGHEFDPNDPNLIRTLKLGAAQEWHVAAQTNVHPFHIHVNPFEVIKRDGSGKIIDRVWRDTFVVTKTSDFYFRTRYDKYIGRSVLHCHNLFHEDRGMMQIIEIMP